MSGWSYEKLKNLTAQTPLPAMFCHLDIFEANARRFAQIAKQSGKKLRIASKSLRVPQLLRTAMAADSEVYQGIMCYSAQEAAFLASIGFDDLLIAYPVVQYSDFLSLYPHIAAGKKIIFMVDLLEHLQIIKLAFKKLGLNFSAIKIKVMIDIDMSFKPFKFVHLGVMRSSIRCLDEFKSLVDNLKKMEEFTLTGCMGYEAQVAGMGELSPFSKAINPIKKLIKKLSIKDIYQKRKDVADWLVEQNISIEIFNGGGSGSLHSTVKEPWITEVTVGSGLLQSHLFDYYASNQSEAALCFGLRITRVPENGIITCHSGGFIASGETGLDRNPIPFLPKEVSPISIEGFGEVQTPLKVSTQSPNLKIGDPVFFRPAKAGEIAEHFNEYLLLQGNQITQSMQTYRGMGYRFF